MKRLILLSMLFISFSSHAYLQPVVDHQSIAKTIKVYRQLKQQYHTMLRHYQMVQMQYQAMVGSSGLGQMFDEADKEFWNWSQEKSHGSPRIVAILKKYEDYFPLLNRTQINPRHSSSPSARVEELTLKTANQALGAADYGIERIGSELELLKKMGNAIDQQKTLKQSVDLNSQMLVRLGQLQTEMIRLQSNVLRVQSTEQQGIGQAIRWKQRFVKDFK